MGFRDSGKAGGLPNKLFPLVITTTLANFNVSMIHINKGSLKYILYAELCDKIDLQTKKNHLMHAPMCKLLTGTLSFSWGFVELMITFGRGRHTRTIYLQFLVVPHKSVYNFILWRIFSGTLDIIVSLLHLKMKYDNVHDKPMTICVDLTPTHKQIPIA